MIPLRRFELLALFFIVVAIFQYPRAMEAKPASFQRYSKVFNTLGVVCKCCDGEGGECKSTWEGSCPKLQCLPWKYQ
ncbi:hypothetical protein PVL29_016742 [Vitis rotundifolia]|uniref:Uncharacterized protein n=1 Tax=Vitis rotundifolia TaxID=103349 RepID=A0AA39DJK4_VITRO|nr:hypothetical protein PVL29_016742 [Vitis rotundifolia]